MRTAFYRKVNIELLAWPAGLLFLYFLDPAGDRASLCLFKNAGIPFCPGCGLGHGIHYFLHGQWQEAIHHHWLAPFTAAALIYRTVQLVPLQFAAFK